MTVPLSPELIEHHVRMHPCPDDGFCDRFTCPCGDAVVICCAACGEALFLALRPGTRCKHAEEVFA